MARKRYTTEQIIGLLREAEVRLSQGQTIGDDLPKLWRLRAELLSLAAGVRRSKA